MQHAVCGVASALIRYSNYIKNPDIRHWFVLVNALIFLSNKISHKKININLNKIYDSCFSEKHIDFDKFSFKSKLSFLKNSISSSIGQGLSRASQASGITKSEGGKKYKTKTIKRRRRTNKKKSTRKNNKKITKK
jgi:hypothetical protein